jgi:hypothetical protein
VAAPEVAVTATLDGVPGLQAKVSEIFTFNNDRKTLSP